MKVIWEGEFNQGHSFAKVNQYLSRFLIKNDAFQCMRFNRDPSSAHSESRKIMDEGQSADVWISHQWPPRLTLPDAPVWIQMIPWEFGSIPKQWYIPLKYLTDEIWVYSQYNKQCYIRNGISEDKIRVIPLGVDDTIFHPGDDHFPLQEGDQESFRFLFVGGTITRKGIDLLLQAYVTEFSKEEDVCLVIKDHGTDSFYKGILLHDRIKQLQKNPRHPRIVYMDQFLTERRLASLYRSCDCLVHPYRGEGFGLPIVEAMACATTAIVPNLGPSQDYCHDGTAFLLTAHEKRLPNARIGEFETVGYPWLIDIHVQELRQMMRYAYENRKIVKEKGERASQYILSHFTWKRSHQVMEEALDRWSTPPTEGKPTKEDIIRLETEQAIKWVQEKKIDQAIEKLNTVLLTYPDSPITKINVATLYIQQEKYLAAVGLLVPVSKQMNEEWDESVRVNVWAALGICYTHLQSWSLAIEAFQRAAQLNPAIRLTELKSLRAGLRSLDILKAHLYKELGDCYAYLQSDFKAIEMYEQSCELDRSQSDKIRERIQSLKQNIQAVKERLPELQQHRRKNPQKGVHWASALQDGAMPLAFILNKKTWENYFLSGQHVLVWGVHSEEVQNRVKDPSVQWDGILLFLESGNIMPAHILNIYQWCRNRLNRDGKIILHTHADDSSAYQAFTSLFSYGGWQQKRLEEQQEIKSGVYSVFQRRAIVVRWDSPYYSSSGYATEQKSFLKALRPYPLQISVHPFDRHLSDSERDDRSQSVRRTSDFSVPIIHCQSAPANLFTVPRAPLSVARSMFETDRLPNEWVENLNEFTEVWVPSEFNKQTFVASGVDESKVYIVPGTLDEQKYSKDRVTPYPLPDARSFVLLSVFDWSVRKGWDILIRAYVETFKHTDDVTLLLKLTRINEPNADIEKEIENLTLSFGSSRPPHIMIMDKEMPEEELIRLYAAVDAFVLPSRGEGWGRPYMEAMAMELPTIGTNWSGNLAFMNKDNSYLIDVETLEPVDSSMPPHFHGHRWARPSVEHLKQILKEVVENPEQAREKGKRARRDLFPRFSERTVGELIYQRFSHLITTYYG